MEAAPKGFVARPVVLFKMEDEGWRIMEADEMIEMELKPATEATWKAREQRS